MGQGKHLSHSGLFRVAEFGRLGWDFGEKANGALPNVGTKLRLGCSVNSKTSRCGGNRIPPFSA